MPSRKSGGARQVAAKHLERDAKRPEGWAERSRDGFKRAVRGKRGLALSLSALEWAVVAAGNDPGPPPETTREQVIRAAQALAKAADPAKLLEELAGELRDAHRVIEQLRGRRGAQVDPGDSGRPQADA